jgi:hypothetical protein
MRRSLLHAALAAAMCWSCSHAVAGGDPEGERNCADRSDLPHGAGLAAAFPGDAGIAKHAAVIFADDFESGELGARWDEKSKPGILSLAGDPRAQACLGRKSLRVEATLGENTGGGLTKWFEPADAVFIRFYVKFDAGCDYVHHFCTLRANRGLRGGDRWSGFGGAGEKPAGDERFSTALEPWGNWGRWPAPGRWNFYSYWHEMDRSRDGKYWGNSFLPKDGKDIPKDRWICAEFMLKHNTPGKDDGEQAFWIDGVLLGHWKGIGWRKTAGLKANALTLESYITDRWTKNRVNVVSFDNVVIAREYVGPSADGGPASDGAQVEVGKQAPDFVLSGEDGKDIGLSSFRDRKSVLLAFYPRDFTPG